MKLGTLRYFLFQTYDKPILTETDVIEILTDYFADNGFWVRSWFLQGEYEKKAIL